MSKKPMPKIKFTSIAIDIADGGLSGKAIAKKHYVSATTVSRVNRYATYGNYLANIQAIKSIKQQAAKRSKYEKAKAAGLNPVTSEQRAERTLAANLEKLQAAPPVAILPEGKKTFKQFILVEVRDIRADQTRLERALVVVTVVLSVLCLVGLFN